MTLPVLIKFWVKLKESEHLFLDPQVKSLPLGKRKVFKQFWAMGPIWKQFFVLLSLKWDTILFIMEFRAVLKEQALILESVSFFSVSEKSQGIH